MSTKIRNKRREFNFATSRNPMTSPSAKKIGKASDSSSWTFFSNHAHVLLCLHQGGDQVLRDVAVEVGITERAVQKIVAELEQSGILTRTKEGRRNRYTINKRARLRHPIESHRSVGDLVKFVDRD